MSSSRPAVQRLFDDVPSELTCMSACPAVQSTRCRSEVPGRCRSSTWRACAKHCTSNELQSESFQLQ
ncbi:hypothetical protein ADL25_43390 [Streptomyces sp. NRRL F-5122]|nr:hypothetical protein ADL25_43390 [Streptomyces sp. NRRL F-5122]